MAHALTRAPRFSQRENATLIKEIEDKLPIITDSSDASASMWSEKKRVWSEIAQSVTAAEETDEIRTEKQVQHKWYDLKCAAKKIWIKSLEKEGKEMEEEISGTDFCRKMISVIKSSVLYRIPFSVAGDENFERVIKKPRTTTLNASGPESVNGTTTNVLRYVNGGTGIVPKNRTIDLRQLKKKIRRCLKRSGSCSTDTGNSDCSATYSDGQADGHYPDNSQLPFIIKAESHGLTQTPDNINPSITVRSVPRNVLRNHINNVERTLTPGRTTQISANVEENGPNLAKTLGEILKVQQERLKVEQEKLMVERQLLQCFMNNKEPRGPSFFGNYRGSSSRQEAQTPEFPSTSTSPGLSFDVNAEILKSDALPDSELVPELDDIYKRLEQASGNGGLPPVDLLVTEEMNVNGYSSDTSDDQRQVGETPPMKKRKKILSSATPGQQSGAYENEIQEIMKMLKESKQPEVETKDLDEDEQFMSSMTTALKRIEPKARYIIKMKIMKLIYDNVFASGEQTGEEEQS